MNNYEKVVLSNGSVYDIAPGGLMSTEESITLILLPGDRTLAQVDSDMDNRAHTSVIQIQDSNGESIDIKKGYVYQTECRKVKDYVIGREPVGNVSEGGVQDYQDIKTTVVSVLLKKSDVRQELNSLKDTVDLLVISSLGV